ncbi:MAG: gamma-glutamyltranspeptidase [Verrucomicrobiales bacterium]|nr:gamma-glutamyltranspeptidase [Verrucomicrobiales bacterium]
MNWQKINSDFQPLADRVNTPIRMASSLSNPLKLATAMASTAFPAATDAALEMLRAGGNAIDAAMAAAWALSVCEPSGSGLGGKTVMLIRFADGKTTVVDGRSQGPASVSKQQVTRAQQKLGYRACSIPTTVAALGHAQRLYGVLPLAQVMEPSIRLAEEGFALTKLYCRQLKWCQDDLRSNPASSRIFLNNGELFQVGDVFRQPILAKTLRRLAQVGTEDFYSGQIARDIVSDMAQHGGLMALSDLSECVQPVQCDAMSASYRGHQMLSVPPPGGGLQLFLALKILEQFSADELRGDQERQYEAVGQVIQTVFRERDSWSVTQQSLTSSMARWMLSEERALELFQKTNWPPSEVSAEDLAEDEEPGETTHLCTSDREGNVVSLTQSIQSLFGAKVSNGELGFLYNNSLCTCPRREHPYQLKGRCLPRSNMAPTILLRDGHPFLALGAAGSRRIISSILQVISGVIDHQLPLTEAMSRARIHVMISGKTHLEKAAATPSLEAKLAKRFGEVRIRARRSYFMGAVQAIQFVPGGGCIGAADPRRDGNAVGISSE